MAGRRIAGGNSFGEEFPPDPLQKPFNDFSVMEENSHY
jgi:hypothetical protein